MIDRRELFSLYKDAFPYDSDDYANYFISSASDDDIVVACRDGKIVSAGYLVSKNASVFGENITLDYLSAVGTLSELRGRGIVAEVMKTAIEKIYVRKDPFVSLNPFNFEYYKRYGFVDASYCGKSLINGGSEYKTVKANYEDVPILMSLYEKYSHAFTFKGTANERYFSDLIDELAVDDESIWLVYDRETPFAYAAIDNGELTKYATDDLRRFKKINAFKGMSFCDFKLKKLVYTQMRVANVESFLSLPIYSDGIGSYEISVCDNLIVENNGKYRIDIAGKDRAITKISYNNDDAVDISDLAKSFFMGQYPFKKPDVLFMDKY